MGATAGQVSPSSTVHRGVLGYGPGCERPVQGILASRLVSIQGRWAGSAGGGAVARLQSNLRGRGEG